MRNFPNYTSTLSVKVTPDFETQVRDAAAQRKVDISVVLRERLGLQTEPATEISSAPRHSTTPAAGKPKSRSRRPMRFAAPGGSDPVVVRLLASVANGLRQTAEAIAGNGAMVAAADVVNCLAALRTMEARLAQLIEHEERKNAH